MHPAQVPHRHGIVVQQNGEEHILRPHQHTIPVVIDGKLVRLAHHVLGAGGKPVDARILFQPRNKLFAVHRLLHAALVQDLAGARVGKIENGKQNVFASDIIGFIESGNLFCRFQNVFQIFTKMIVGKHGKKSL